MRHDDALRALKHKNYYNSFWQQVNFAGPDGCWLWKGPIDVGCGYGRLIIGGSKKYAHRHVWQLTNGSIPDGFCVLHRCARKLCVAPHHLYAGKHTDNMQDALRDGALKGSRLNETMAIDIAYFRFERGWSYLTLAEKFGVSPQSIANVCKGRTWSYVTGIQPAGAAA